MKHSLIFLYYDPRHQLDFPGESLKSMVRHAGTDDYEVVFVCNIKGYAAAVNLGLHRAKGEFMFLMNDDVLVEEDGWLDKMAVPDTITSWRFNQFFMTGELLPDGAAYCIPRSVYDRLGGFDERYCQGYGFDETDYWFRAKQVGVPMLERPVTLRHLENKTYKAYHSEQKEQMTERNHMLFVEKWKEHLPMPYGTKA